MCKFCYCQVGNTGIQTQFISEIHMRQHSKHFNQFINRRLKHQNISILGIYKIIYVRGSFLTSKCINSHDLDKKLCLVSDKPFLTGHIAVAFFNIQTIPIDIILFYKENRMDIFFLLVLQQEFAMDLRYSYIICTKSFLK